MARPREFDVDEALQSALEVFWRKGYEATSVQDLVAAMGIQKASLYGTFGDKRSLYVTALLRYQEQGRANFAAAMVHGASPIAAIRRWLEQQIAGACGREAKRGCFCVNANIELAASDPQIGELLRTHSEKVEALLAATLDRARQNGELAKSADTAQLATFLFGIAIAITVLGKQRAGKPRLQALLDQALAALRT